MLEAEGVELARLAELEGESIGLFDLTSLDGDAVKKAQLSFAAF